MESSPVPFQVWDLPWQDDEPHDEPHLDNARRIVGVSIYHGQSLDKGPGAIVASFDPQLTFVDGQIRPEGNHFEILMRGPLALGREIALRLARMAPGSKNSACTQAPDALEPPLRYPVHDAFFQCGNTLVPALEFGFGAPEATVIVSADLLAHPIALGLWRWRVKVPVLHHAEFDWK